MLCTFRPALAVAALLCSSAFVHAGPIEWSIRSDPDSSRFGKEFYFGTYEFPQPDPGGSWATVHAYGTMPEGLLPVGAGSTNDILLAVQSKQAYRLDTAGPTDPAASNQVPYIVWLTDQASGESGWLSFDLTALFLTGMPTTDHSEVVFSGSGGGTLILGKNRYELQFRTSESETGAYITADLTVAPVAATPEPGSLALAGFGLAAVFARRLRRAR